MLKQDVKVTDNSSNVAGRVCDHDFGMLTRLDVL